MGIRGLFYLCVIQLGFEACHLPPWHAEGLLYHLHMTSALLYSISVFPRAVLVPNIQVCHRCISIHTHYIWPDVQYVISLTIGNIAPKCLWLIIDWMSTDWHNGIVLTEVDYSWFQTFAMFWMLYAFCWVIPRCLNFMCLYAYKIQTLENYTEVDYISSRYLSP